METTVPMKQLLHYQKNEITAHESYKILAKREKDGQNKKLIQQIANDELRHYRIWQSYTKQDIKPNIFTILVFQICSRLMGFTFAIKLMEKGEDIGMAEYEELGHAIPNLKEIMADEKRHENDLIGLLDEERLQYVGAMILGLNDALVELTGTIAGLTFAMANNRLVAMSAIITGIAATLSMASSNYLAEKADGAENPIKSSAFTGGTYLLAVVLLVLPYLLFPANMYIAAFVTMLVIVLVLIAFFNYYISVAKDQPFMKPFGQMAAISFGVMIISYLIGIAAKAILHIDVM
jgi:VIT1/CCC1 family predicted Fe2+/Mn2+ transporter